MALTISERWIRERVHLEPTNLDEVRSLALPGTYHEKITHLGRSLQNLLGLKHLDLSRNALQSLDGLQHLAVLERLNIYYNNISTLKDLYQLRHNTSLQEVDLRLNPVTKNEPDYRLFMVHMLPNLRKLDDRSVRENERKAALMHFDTDQATELTERPSGLRSSGSDRVTNARADMVAGMTRKTTVLDEDDCDVLDLIARSGGDLCKAREITGSKAKSSKAVAHSQEDYGRDSSDDRRPRSPDSKALPSTKYPPSPQSPRQNLTEAPRRRNVWKEDESKHRSQYLEDRMQGLELSEDRDTPDNKIPVDDFYSFNSSPKANLSPKSPSLPPSLKSLPSLSPSSKSTLGMRPVIDLYQNLASLKTTVIQSYLDDSRNRTPLLNISRADPKAHSKTRSPDKADISPSKEKIVNKDVRLQSVRHKDGYLESLDHYSKSVSRSKSPINPLYTRSSHGSSPVREGVNDSNVREESIPLSEMWEYGLPLGTDLGKVSQKVSANSLNHSIFKGQAPLTSPRTSQIKSPHRTSPNKTTWVGANPSLPSNTASDNPQRKLTVKAVTFMTPLQGSLTQTERTQTSPLSSPSKTPAQPLPKSEPNQPQCLHALILTSPPETQGAQTQSLGGHPQSKERVRVQFIDETDASIQENSNVKYAEETKAYTAYTSRGNFTPHPDLIAENDQLEPAPVKNGHPARPDAEDLSVTHERTTAGDRVDLSLFLDNFLTLVDRYWNGTKSLHRHGKFQNQAHVLLKTLLSGLLEGVPQEPVIPQEAANELSRLHQAVRSAQQQVESLKEELKAALADKRHLQECLDEVQHEKLSGDQSCDQSADSQASRGIQSGVLQRELAKLSQENESLKVHVKHFHQLQELATMLQESHKSLVTTNDHLLQELDENKQRHLEEVKQLHWSYGELKRTVEMSKRP